MTSLWNLGGALDSLQKNLDDAAGLATAPQTVNNDTIHETSHLHRATTANAEQSDSAPSFVPISAIHQTPTSEQNNIPHRSKEEVDETPGGSEKQSSSPAVVVNEPQPPVTYMTPQHQQHQQPSRIQQLEEEGRNLSLQLGKEKDRIRTLLSEKRTLESELNAASVRERQWADSRVLMESAEVAMRGTVDRLRHRVEELETELLNLRKEVARSQTTTVELEEELGKSQLMALTKERESDIEIRKLRDEIKKIQEDGDRRLSALQQEVIASQSRCHTAEMKCVEFLRAVSDSTHPLQEQIQHYESMLTPLQENLRKKSSEVTKVTEMNATLAVQVSALQASLREAQTEIIHLQSDKDTLRRENKLEIEKHMVEKESLHAIISQKSKALQDALQSLQSERDAYRHALTTTTSALQQQQHIMLQEELEAQAAIAAKQQQATAMLSSEQLLVSASVGNHPEAVLKAKVSTLEKQLLRVMHENSSVRAIVAELEKLRKQHAELESQHDILLQMYGEVVERSNGGK